MADLDKEDLLNKVVERGLVDMLAVDYLYSNQLEAAGHDCYFDCSSTWMHHCLVLESEVEPELAEVLASSHFLIYDV